MPKTISLVINARVSGGSTIDIRHEIPIGATDHLHLKIPEAASDHAIDLQPADKSKLELLLIRCADPGDYGGVSFAHASNAAAKDRIPIDRAILMTGRGGLHGLPDKPTALYFHNEHDRDVPLEILVGRRVGA